jgi:hypothetical protein
MKIAPGSLSFTTICLPQFVRHNASSGGIVLSALLVRPVVDTTGDERKFDFHLR